VHVQQHVDGVRHLEQELYPAGEHVLCTLVGIQKQVPLVAVACSETADTRIAARSPRSKPIAPFTSNSL
jgi:hypothetical protein